MQRHQEAMNPFIASFFIKGCIFRYVRYPTSIHPAHAHAAPVDSFCVRHQLSILLAATIYHPVFNRCATPCFIVMLQPLLFGGSLYPSTPDWMFTE